MRKNTKLNMARLMACLFLFTNFSFAKILKDEVSLIKDTSFSFQEVCLKMTKRKAELIEMNSITALDCMGTIIDVGKFCYKQMAHDPYYIRGAVNSKSKKVICKSAKKVIIKYECYDGESLCKDAEIGCFKLQERLAARLRLSHHSISTLGSSGLKVLNCYFTPKDDSYLKLKE
jgi:hypothetical protein